MVELSFSHGDEVRFRLAKEELDAVVLESSEKDIVLVKLSSGYNIGIPKENILFARKIPRKRIVEEKKEFALPKKEGLGSIGIIATGGTIASRLDYKTGGVKPLSSIEDFAKNYPEIFEIANVKKIEIPFLVLSESMSYEHWIKIAEKVKEMLDDNDIKGVIVTHGTDTLHYTAAALSFFLRNLGKPVVLTYSQRSIDRASSDAHLNLLSAVKMALSDCAEVMIVGHANSSDDYCYALRGTKAKKMHSSRRDAFKSINAEPIAKISENVEFISSYNKRDNSKRAELDTNFTDKVALIKYYPGQNPEVLDYYALKYKGIVVEATGLGHVAASDSLYNNWIPVLKKHIRNGFVVCMTSQTIYGRVDPFVYSNGRDLQEAGVIFLEDMLSETALVKLGWVLGHYGWKKNVKEKMLENFAGEISERLVLG